MHLKNFSLRETESGNRSYCLSCAYDMLPVNIIIPEDEEQLALTLNGKKRNIHKKDFRLFAQQCALPEKSVERMMNKLCLLEDKFLNQCEDAYFPQELREKTKTLIKERIKQLL